METFWKGLHFLVSSLVRFLQRDFVTWTSVSVHYITQQAKCDFFGSPSHHYQSLLTGTTLLIRCLQMAHNMAFGLKEGIQVGLKLWSVRPNPTSAASLISSKKLVHQNLNTVFKSQPWPTSSVRIKPLKRAPLGEFSQPFYPHEYINRGLCARTLFLSLINSFRLLHWSAAENPLVRSFHLRWIINFCW